MYHNLMYLMFKNIHREYLTVNGKKKGEQVTAHLKLKPEVNLAQTTRIAQLEHR